MKLEDRPFLSLSLSPSLFLSISLPSPSAMSTSFLHYKYMSTFLTECSPSSIIWLVFNMWKGSQRTGFMTPSFADEQTATPLKPLKSYLDSRPRGSSQSSGKNRISDLLNSSPARLFSCIKNSVRRSFSLLSRKQRSLQRGSPSEAAAPHFVPPRDSHHSEAMEDCIEFINSSYRKSL